MKGKLRHRLVRSRIHPCNVPVPGILLFHSHHKSSYWNKYNQDKNLWKSLNVTSPQMYFGSSTGVFRIFPARQSRECGVYDPRLRPWYQAAVSTFVFALQLGFD